MNKWKHFILACIWGPFLVLQIVLVFIFGFVNDSRLYILEYTGYAVWVISFIFGWLPIFILKIKGSVAKGKSYVHTTTIVKTGLYSIIRHPQYTAGILFSLALMLVSQTFLITLLGIIVIPLLYMDIVKADKFNIEKFGDEYRQYMKEVPRTNFVLGIIRRLSRKKD